MRNTSNIIWAPWRDCYLNQTLKIKSRCVFCRIFKERKDTDNHVIVRKKTCFALLNIYPYNNGHTLIVTNRHVADLDDLKKAEREELMDLLQVVKSILQKELNPSGFNVGINLGKPAGAGYPGHLHMHIVPRWEGDVNFMPVIAGTKVMSQSLKTLHKKLIDAYKKRY